MSEQLTTPAEKAPASVSRRLFVGAGLFVVVLMMLAAIQYTFQRSRDNKSLQRALAELDETDPGWRLEDIEQAMPSIPDAQNSATVVLGASRLLSPTAFRPLTIIKPARVGQLFDPKQMNLLAAELTAAHAGLVEARKLADMPAGRYPPEYYHDSPVFANHLRAAGRVIIALDYDALYLAQVHRPSEALRSCRAMFNVAKSIDDEPLIFSQAARCSVVLSAITATERTLALSAPTSEDIVDLQKVLEDEETHPGLLLGQRANRAMVFVRLDAVIRGLIHVEDLFSERSPGLGWRVKYARWTIRDAIRRGFPDLLQFHNRAIEIARLPLQEQVSAENELKDDIVMLARNWPFYSQSWPDVVTLGQVFRDKIARLRCLMVLLGLERYRQDKGTWPATLEELTPKPLKSVPLDPYDGKPLRYKKLPDGVVVYSVGPDKIDHGGLIDGSKRTATGFRRDVGLRLWDVKHRRQPPPEKCHDLTCGTLHLIERRSRLCRLAPSEVDFLLAHHRTALELLPTARRHVYRVTPAGMAGVIVTPYRRMVVSSKVPLRNLLLLMDSTDDPPTDRDMVQPADGGEMIDLLAGQLALRMSERAAAGLHRGYRETAVQGAYLVGRLDVAEQLRQQSRGKEQIHSRWDEFTDEIVCNQVPRSVAVGLLASDLLSAAVREHLTRALAAFAHLDEVPLTADVLTRLTRDRVPDSYGPLIDLCRLLIDSLAPSPVAGSVPVPAFLLSLERLFECYVTRAVQEAFADENGVTVSAQESSLIGEPVAGQPAIHVRPDVRVDRDGAPLLVLDAKWKRLPATSVITDDFYQALAYCTVLGAPRAVLVYPGRCRRVWEYTFAHTGASVQVRTLDVGGSAEQCRKARRRMGKELRGMALPSP